MKNVLKLSLLVSVALFLGTISVSAQEKVVNEVKTEKATAAPTTPVTPSMATPDAPTKKACCKDKGESCKKGEGKACCKKGDEKSCDKKHDGKKCEEKDCKKACCAGKKEESHEGHKHE